MEKTYLLCGFGDDFEIGVFEAHAAATQADDADAHGAKAIDELIDARLMRQAGHDAKLGGGKSLPGRDGERTKGFADDRLRTGEVEMQLQRFRRLVRLAITAGTAAAGS